MVQPHTVADTVAGNVRSEMARQRVTQADVAPVLKLTRQAVSRRLTGQTDFTVTEIHAIAEFLGVPTASLLEVGTEQVSA